MVLWIKSYVESPSPEKPSTENVCELGYSQDNKIVNHALKQKYENETKHFKVHKARILRQKVPKLK